MSNNNNTQSMEDVSDSDSSVQVVPGPIAHTPEVIDLTGDVSSISSISSYDSAYNSDSSVEVAHGAIICALDDVECDDDDTLSDLSGDDDAEGEVEEYHARCRSTHVRWADHVDHELPETSCDEAARRVNAAVQAAGVDSSAIVSVSLQDIPGYSSACVPSPALVSAFGYASSASYEGEGYSSPFQPGDYPPATQTEFMTESPLAIFGSSSMIDELQMASPVPVAPDGAEFLTPIARVPVMGCPVIPRPVPVCRNVLPLAPSAAVAISALGEALVGLGSISVLGKRVRQTMSVEERAVLDILNGKEEAYNPYSSMPTKHALTGASNVVMCLERFATSPYGSYDVCAAKFDKGGESYILHDEVFWMRIDTADKLARVRALGILRIVMGGTVVGFGNYYAVKSPP